MEKTILFHGLGHKEGSGGKPCGRTAEEGRNL